MSINAGISVRLSNIVGIFGTADTRGGYSFTAILLMAKLLLAGRYRVEFSTAKCFDKPLSISYTSNLSNITGLRFHRRSSLLVESVRVTGLGKSLLRIDSRIAVLNG